MIRLSANYKRLFGKHKREFLAAALLIAVSIFGMPASKGLAVALFGAAYGLFPIGGIILNVIFLYNLASENPAENKTPFATCHVVFY